MSQEITVNGRKLLRTLQNEFTEKYEYLFLAFIVDEDRGKSVNVKSLKTDIKIVDARKQFSNEEISLNGKTLIKNMEKYFWEELGIAVQIAVKDYSGHAFYFPIGDYFNGLSLTKANIWAKDNGCSIFKDVKELSGKIVF
jgi:hypothetical protein